MKLINRTIPNLLFHKFSDFTNFLESSKISFCFIFAIGLIPCVAKVSHVAQSVTSLTNFLINLGIEKKETNEFENFILEIFKKKFQSIEDINQKIKIISLSILDFLWSRHLEDLEALKESVRIRAYGAKDPLAEYKIEAKRLWQGFFDNFEFLLFQAFFGLKENEPKSFIETEKTSQKIYQPKGKKKIGRNDPCPCGSGKKYKYCCGRNEV